MVKKTMSNRAQIEKIMSSAKKAIANVWWKRQKQGDRYRDTNYRISDFDAVEMED